MTTTYTMPEMPLDCGVWYSLVTMPPPEEPDDVIRCSLSPIRPEDFLRGTEPLGVARVTHIIRCLPDSEMGDNSGALEPNALFPCTLFECPIGSGHWYATVWYHEVGAGFSNHHARVYVTRYSSFHQNNLPRFQGWI